ncbi:MAG: DUF4263 domain-containing protein [Bacteroidales bacterium]|nr:DUF4263 domain-containing protein [Bacteroidales bacterium]
MISFKKHNNYLVLVYSPMNGIDWIQKLVEADNDISFKIFTFEKEDVLIFNNASDSVEFIFGILQPNDYYLINGKKVSINHNIFLHKDIDCKEKFFVTKRKRAVFNHIDELVKKDIFIGGDYNESIPEKRFYEIVNNFPNDWEIKKYIDARLGAVLRNYFSSVSDYEEKYNKYMNNRLSLKPSNVIEGFRDFDFEKYSIILDELKLMLANESAYNESNWQKGILNIILLLYPKYLYVIEKVPVRQGYGGGTKQLDFLLVDFSGHVDIIEIKKSFNEPIMSNNKYRGNHIPLRELSGAAMQIEKYLFYLNKSGISGEQYLTNKYKEIFPLNFNIKITNPSGIIIMGRSNDLSSEQKNDFEVVKRKYKNIIDIITYDDLIDRLESLLIRLKK